MADRHPWKKRAEQMALGAGAVRGTAQGELLPSEGQLGEADFFPTPDWCIEGLLQVCPPPRFTCGDAIHGRDMVVLEPAAGSGAIVRLLLAADYQVRALEIRPRALPELRKLCPAEWGCWLRFSEPGRGYPELVKLCGCELNRVAICTNPPYAIARDFVMQALLTPSPWVAMLLRVDVLASRPWDAIFGTGRRTPDCRPQPPRCPGTLTPPTTIAHLRRRPSFSGDGNTSMSNYAWLIWEVGKEPIDMRPIG